jgi:peptidoglycan glycosyltransferase
MKTRTVIQKIIFPFIVLVPLLITVPSYSLSFFQNIPFIRKDFNFDHFRSLFHQYLFENADVPSRVVMDGKAFSLSYSMDPNLEDYVFKMLKSYRSDFSSVVMLDNETGKILVAIEYDKEKDKKGRISTFTPSHPAASIFKIITAADLLENTHVSQNTQFLYAGKSTTLYKHQLKTTLQKRWTRTSDFEQAFARSNNVIFGKAALENLSPTGLKKMAEKFGFNRQLLPLEQMQPSNFPMANDQYNFAELASGFNVKTLITPIHGALIASIAANKGKMRYPAMVQEIKNEQGEIVWSSPKAEEVVVEPQTAEYLRKLMLATVEDGTARKAFRRRNKGISEIEIGGKTGSITGGLPYGKRDWFVAYARETNNPEDKGISICVMIVNKKRWYVKSTFLTKQLIEYYYNNFKS